MPLILNLVNGVLIFKCFPSWEVENYTIYAALIALVCIGTGIMADRFPSGISYASYDYISLGLW